MIVVVINKLKIMNKLYALLVLLFFCCANVYSQVNYDAYIGTWVYQKNDTVFKIKLQKGTSTSRYGNSKRIFGGYSLCVNREIKEQYIKEMPPVWVVNTSAPSNNIYIVALNDNTPNFLGFGFYDQRKKHLNGEGIGGGKIELLAPNKIHWTLNEWEGLWDVLEGEGVEGDNRPGIRESMIGFSVPTDVIMIKEQ
jgi:hypothetical protein